MTKKNFETKQLANFLLYCTNYREHTNVKKILVDNIPHKNGIHVIDCAEAIENPEKLQMFDGRNQLHHRSK